MGRQSPSRKPKASPLAREAQRGFGARLRAIRHQRALTQGQLGLKVKLPAGTISRYERGCTSPSLLVLLRLRKALHVTLDYLIAGARSAAVQDTRLQRCAEQADQLPEEARLQFLRIVDSFLAGALPGEASSSTASAR